MYDITGTLMSGDHQIATIENSTITKYDEKLIPLYLKRTKNIEKWLALRAIDSHRTNSRLLKKVLRLKTDDDVQVALAVNAATITDRYWFKAKNSKNTYDDIRFKENYFDQLALRGDPDSFSQSPSRTPELTNTGSFEKCWKLIDQNWWMYKSGSNKELFSELFICKLGENLNFNMAHYEMDGKYIRSKDFTNGAKVNFESMYSLADSDDDYEKCFNILMNISSDLARQYLILIYMDTICYNMDRHTENFGLLRNVNTGEILTLAPNYDNNIALISRGYPKDVSRKNDGLIKFFQEFVKNCDKAFEMYKSIALPNITRHMIEKCINEIKIDIDQDFVCQFILNGQCKINEILDK